MVKQEITSRSWALKVLLVLSATVWLMLMAASWAESAQAASSSSNSDEEYNFSWLDPDKKIYVLQNRRYQKEGKLMLSAMIGPGFSNSYKNAFSLQPRAGYYFTETLGFEVFYMHGLNSYNALFDELIASGTNVVPRIREIKSQMGALLSWSPWYAKLNVFNTILYFDWYFEAGLGQVTTSVEQRSNTTPTLVGTITDESGLGFFIGTGHQFHLSEKFFVRTDFLVTLYSASVVTSTSGGSQSTLFSSFNVGLGLGLRL